MRTKLLLIFTISLLAHYGAFSQQSINGKVVSASDGKPIAYAYVFLTNAEKYGTVTNEEGAFYLSGYSPTDTLVVSHISFHSLKLPAKQLSKEIEVKLEDRQYFISEITISAITAGMVFQLVKENLKNNHLVGPVTYQAFSRSLQYDKAIFDLHMIQEMAVKVNVDKKNKVKVKFERTRSRSFVGADRIDPYHLMDELLSILEIDVLSWRIWDKKFMQTYDPQLEGTEILDGEVFLKLVLKPKDPEMPKHTLYIDEDNYAVSRYLVQPGTPDGPTYDTFLKKVNGKWHVAYVKQSRWARSMSTDNAMPLACVDHTLTCNLVEYEPVTDDYKGYMNFLTGTTVNWEKTLDPWDHPFWQTYRNIPLPGWIQAVVGE